MASVKLILFKGKKYKDNRFPVMVQIIHEGKVRRISSGGSAHENEWDEETKLFKTNRPNYKRMNEIIQSLVIGSVGLKQFCFFIPFIFMGRTTR